LSTADWREEWNICPAVPLGIFEVIVARQSGLVRGFEANRFPWQWGSVGGGGIGRHLCAAGVINLGGKPVIDPLFG
jgi:hypothetical protein